MTQNESAELDPFAPSEGGGRFKFGMVRLHLVQGVKAKTGSSINAPFKNPYKSGDDAIVQINGKQLAKGDKGKLIVIEGHFKDKDGNKYLEPKAYLDWDAAYKEKVYPSIKEVFKGKPPMDKLVPVKLELIPTGRKNETTGKDYYDWTFAEAFKTESAMNEAESKHFGRGDENGNAPEGNPVFSEDMIKTFRKNNKKGAEWIVDNLVDDEVIESLGGKEQAMEAVKEAMTPF